VTLERLQTHMIPDRSTGVAVFGGILLVVKSFMKLARSDRFPVSASRADFD
jgi:hypothetical protein